MNTLLSIADAVVTALNAGGFSRPFAAERKYQPVFEAADLADLRVSVVPKGMTLAVATRAADDCDCSVDIGVQQKVDVDNPAQLDALMALVQEIIERLRRRPLEACPAAVWVSLKNEPVFAPEHLNQQHVFTSVLTVTYRLQT